MSGNESVIRTELSVDPNRPYLMPRRDGGIDVARVAVDATGAPVLDERGWLTMVSQQSGAQKLAHPTAFGDDVQGYYADILGQSRPGVTHEQMLRYGDVSTGLANLALSRSGIESPLSQNDDTMNEVYAVLNEQSWDDIEMMTGRGKKHVELVVAQLDLIDQQLSSLAYAGGKGDGRAQQLRDSFDALKQTVDSNYLPQEIKSHVESLQENVEYLAEKSRQDINENEDVRNMARRLDVAVQEMSAAARNVTILSDEIRNILASSGSLNDAISELAITTDQHSILVNRLRTFTEKVNGNTTSLNARLNMIEAEVAAIKRLRTSR